MIVYLKFYDIDKNKYRNKINFIVIQVNMNLIEHKYLIRI